METFFSGILTARDAWGDSTLVAPRNEGHARSMGVLQKITPQNFTSKNLTLCVCRCTGKRHVGVTHVSRQSDSPIPYRDKDEQAIEKVSTFPLSLTSQFQSSLSSPPAAIPEAARAISHSGISGGLWGRRLGPVLEHHRRWPGGRVQHLGHSTPHPPSCRERSPFRDSHAWE